MTEPLKISGLTIQYRRSSELRSHPQNARSHTKKQIETVAKSIKTYGWTNPILIDEESNVIAGHARLAASKSLGIDKVPTIGLANMTPAQKRAYIIADNRLNEIAGSWDRKLLALEHEAIQLLDPEFDLTSTGFSLEDVEIMFDAQLEIGEDLVPVPNHSEPATSQVGDLWVLGEHRLLCGDALKVSSFEQLFGAERAQMVIADNPYNVRINGNVAAPGKHREFSMASGEMTKEEFIDFLRRAFANLIQFSEMGSIHYLFMDWRHLAEMIEASAQYAEMKNLICWNKQSAGMGSFYRSQHELIFVMKNGTSRHINNFGLGEKGRHRTNVWDYPGLSGWSNDRSEQLAMHPTVKPVAMIADAIRDCSRKNGIVVDCFGGSGTTLMAADQTGRRARLIELDPAYVDVTICRWQAASGGKAILADSGRSFEEVKREGR